MQTNNCALQRMRYIAASIVAILLFNSPTPARADRLPTTVRPDHYALTLTPDLKAATYSGSETIDVVLTEPTTSITLNAAEIDFKTVKIAAQGKEQTAAVALDEGKQQATFTVPKAIPAGKATLSIEFTGTLNNELRGFYLSKTPRRNYAVTQFEALDARRG
ncbi:MAG TPA: M1 family peptidase, partial [Terracidiphilus sp.]|nr:M1 family peptidase [Terracidiphilus sp.]